MTPSIPNADRRPYPLARVMFCLAFLDLLLVAGIVHRATSPSELVYRIEVDIMIVGHSVLWPIIAIEAWISFFRRDRAIRPFWATAFRAFMISLAPPLRMGMPCPYTGGLWVPFWGWCDRGKALEDRLERGFHKPMLVFALLLLPVLGIAFFRADAVKESRALAMAIDIAVAVIWVAFALEFTIKVSAIRRPFIYSKERWLDLAIVLLPMLEFALTSWSDAAPLARLLRLTRAVAPDQLAKMGQMYRLRGLLMKGWRAVLVLRIVAKLTGNTLQKQLKRTEIQIADKEIELADLRAMVDTIRSKLALERDADEKDERERDPTSRTGAAS